MNLVKRSSVGGGIKSKVGASRRIKALVGATLLSTFDFLAEPWPTSLFCFSVKLAGRLI